MLRPAVKVGGMVGGRSEHPDAVVRRIDVVRIGAWFRGLGDVELVASTDIGTQNIFVVFPSLAAGIGVPLRVHPTIRPGVRAQAALGWPFVSLIGTFDVFPALGTGDLELFGGVMLQLNL